MMNTSSLFPLRVPNQCAESRTCHLGGDTLFTWTGNWNVTTPTSNPCPGCIATPDPSQMFDQTWHESGIDGPTGGSIQFTGMEVYVQGADYPGHGSVSFSLDGGSPVVYTSQATSGWIYNNTFFNATDLSTDGVHEVVFTVYGTVILDSAIVVNISQTVVTSTSPNLSTSTSHSPSSTTTVINTTAPSHSSGFQKFSSSTSSVLTRSPKITVTSQSSSSFFASNFTYTSSSTAVSESLDSPKATQSTVPHSNRVNTAAIGIGVSGGIVVFLTGTIILLYRNRKRKILQAREEDSHSNQSTDKVLSKSATQSLSVNTDDDQVRLDQAVDRRESQPSVVDDRRFWSLSASQEMVVEYQSRMQLLRDQDFDDDYTDDSRSVDEELPPYYDGRQDVNSARTSPTLDTGLPL